MLLASLLTVLTALAPEPEPAREGFVTARDGMRLFYTRTGSGPVRLIVPGGFLGLESTGWLPKKGSAVFYDMRGRGRSSEVPPDGDFTIEADVLDLEDVRKEVGTERFSLVGYSYLGLVAALYATRFPDRVDRLVALGPVPRKAGTSYPPALVYQDDAWARVEARKRELAGRPQQEICEAVWPLTAAALVGLPERASRIGPIPCSWTNEWPEALADRFERLIAGSLRKLDPPRESFFLVNASVLVVHGTKDRNAPYGSGREWAMTFPNARLLTVEGAAHAAWVEDDGAKAAIATFLRGEWPQDAAAVSALDPAEDVEAILGQARDAMSKKAWPVAAERYEAASRLVPKTPAVLLRRAEALANFGRTSEALSAMERAATFGVPSNLPALDKAFAATPKNVDEERRFKAVRKVLADSARPIVRGKEIFSLREKELRPESVAYDPRTGSWFVGSMHLRKIVKVDKTRRETDLVKEGQDGLWGVIGIKLDPISRELWACAYNGTSPPMKKPEAATVEHGALFRWNIDTGLLIARYEPPFQPLAFNDLVLSPKGDVYLTGESRVYRLPKGGTQIEAFTPALGLLNGIALSDDGSRLFVSDHRRGVLTIEIATRAVRELAGPEDLTLAGVDGLYVRGRTLVAVQNGAGDESRVLRADLDPSLARIESYEVLDRAHPAYDVPTTGVLVGDEVHYVAASNLGSFYQSGGKIVPEKLRRSAILRVALR